MIKLNSIDLGGFTRFISDQLFNRNYCTNRTLPDTFHDWNVYLIIDQSSSIIATITIF